MKMLRHRRAPRSQFWELGETVWCDQFVQRQEGRLQIIKAFGCFAHVRRGKAVLHSIAVNAVAAVVVAVELL